MAENIPGVGAGAVIPLLKEALVIARRGWEFESTLERSRETLNSLTREVEKIKRLSPQLDRSREELETLENHLRAFKELVDKYSKFSRWRCPFFPCYQYRLEKKEKDINRHTTSQNSHRLLDIVSKICDIRIILQNLYMKENINICGAIGEQECVGMDEYFNKLKLNLLLDDAPVHVFTGLVGSGKTTLAKKIYFDPEIKAEFKGNIFFARVSKEANWKVIIETLFGYCGSGAPAAFQSNEDAATHLEGVLRGFKNPILLILDDVWPSSEALVQKFKILIPDYKYKVLVTSRVALPGIGPSSRLDQLDHHHALALFSHYARPYDRDNSYTPPPEVVNQIVRSCLGSPKALKATGISLCGMGFETWKTTKESLETRSILDFPKNELLNDLKESLDMLERENKFPSINQKECFMDLGLFPADKRIPVVTLIDMWAELYDLNNDGSNAVATVLDLTYKNFINLNVTRKIAKVEDMYYYNHFITLPNLLRELAIHQSKDDKPFNQRKRLFVDLKGNNRPKWSVSQNQPKVDARILSISTDEEFTSKWCDMQPDEAEVLILNMHSSQYTLPEFTERMSKLKVLIVTNYASHCSELKNFDLLGSLSNLKRIRLEKVSVPSLCIWKNLRKFSLHMCNAKQAFENCSNQISDAMPNLVEMSIDYCNDLVKLPDGLCNIAPLKKLSITNCHRFSALPQDIAKLKNLEVLRLCSCSDLEEMPYSVDGLNKLSCLDISYCLKLSKLPDDIGGLKKLEKLYMKGCTKLSELPNSLSKIDHKIYVIYDDEMADSWRNLADFPNLKKEILNVDPDLKWLPAVPS
ncbi:hypothetical protein VNO78_08220 [Psophocarpus tetragonolobus]|uniref:Disease resistance protein n=1 Tax=Psophocarpus tetragonolobus TaxID=3891 RepID=A0AAN9SW30_PSOTE